MNISVTIDQASLDSFVRSTEQRLGQAKEAMSRSMATKFYDTTKDNIGDIGVDRPHEWKRLHPDYARKVGRAYATLYVNGFLEGAIKMESSSEGWWVGISKDDCEYALAHQFGHSNSRRTIPPRPYFPITDKDTYGGDFPTLTPHTHELVMQAAREEFSRAFA